MKLQLNWHASWTAWKEYESYGRPYQSRKRQLFLGRICVATLVESTNPKYHHRFFMFAEANVRISTVKDVTAFRCARRFIREMLLHNPGSK